MTFARGERSRYLFTSHKKNGRNFLSDPILFSNYAGWIRDKLFITRVGIATVDAHIGWPRAMEPRRSRHGNHTAGYSEARCFRQIKSGQKDDIDNSIPSPRSMKCAIPSAKAITGRNSQRCLLGAKVYYITTNSIKMVYENL